jgi:hypothetical protein
MKSIDVGGTALQLPSHIFETGEKKGTIIDSGTTLTYLPELVYKDVMAKVWQRPSFPLFLCNAELHTFPLRIIFLNQLQIFEKHQDMTFRSIQDFLCFTYHGRYYSVVFNIQSSYN